MIDNSYLKENTLLLNDTYRIIRVLGQGGFGITYLAEHTRLKKQVAIKEFYPRTLCDRNSETSCVRANSKANSDAVDRFKHKFIKEAEHIAELDSPYIIKVADVFEANGTAYYVMDYIEGSSLADIVKENGPLSEREAIGFVSKIGDALLLIHSKQMNHLDIKPGNIMIRKKNKTPILIDFGLSKQYDSDGNQTSTTPIGISHGYAPIEQYRDGGVREFSPQTDLYSLAATLYYILTGIVPPQAPNLLDEELAFPNSMNKALMPILLKAMSAKRVGRHASIDEFINNLKNISTNSEDIQIIPASKEYMNVKEDGIRTKANPKEEPIFPPIFYIIIVIMIVIIFLFCNLI